MTSETDIHPEMERLYAAVADVADLPAERKGRQSAFASSLNESPQTVNNWESRGPSAKALLACQAKFGVNATWVQTGEGARYITASAAVASMGTSHMILHKPAMHASPVVTAAAIVDGLALLLAEIEIPTRRAVLALLDGLVDDPRQAAAPTSIQVEALVQAGKRRSA